MPPDHPPPSPLPLPRRAARAPSPPAPTAAGRCPSARWCWACATWASPATTRRRAARAGDASRGSLCCSRLLAPPAPVPLTRCLPPAPPCRSASPLSTSCRRGRRRAASPTATTRSGGAACLRGWRTAPAAQHLSPPGHSLPAHSQPQALPLAAPRCPPGYPQAQGHADAAAPADRGLQRRAAGRLR